MSRKHFEAIAAEMRILVDAAKSKAELETLNSTVAALCDVFKGINGRFDRQRFFRACGL